MSVSLRTTGNGVAPVVTQPATVLVVDDEQTIRHLLAQFLRVQGHQVIMAEDGAEALACIRKQPIDLILLDMLMPGISGFDVLHELKQDPNLADIPVVIISAETDIENVAACIKMGAEDYLPKPFNRVILGARVSACLERRRLRSRERAYQNELEVRVAERTAALAVSEAAQRSQATLLTSVLDGMGDGVVVVDTAGRLLRHNPAAQQILGEQIQYLLPSSPEEPTPFYRPDLSAAYLPSELPLAQAIRGYDVTGFEVAIPEAGAGGQWLNITAHPLSERLNEISGGVAVFRDISAAKRAEVALRESEESYALAARGANDGLWDWDLRNKQIYFSPRWKTMLGFAEDEIGTEPAEWFKRVHPEDRELLEVRLAAHHRQLITHFEHEYRILHKDGTYRWMLCRGLAVWDEHGQAVRMAGSQTDISERKRAEERLVHDALHDDLTGLPNRTLFLDRLNHALSRTTRYPDYRFAVMFLDLDRFKVVNDSLGHPTGDLLLQAIARRLEHCVRPGDTVARLGGDEFTILLDDLADDQTVVTVAERVQQALAAPVLLHGQELFTTVSIGITTSAMGYERALDLIRDADTAMYRAKMNGKAQAVLFDPQMHALAMEQLQLESSLRWAVERNEIRIQYQPIVNLRSGQVAGFEALVRWLHPQRGLLYPGTFIQLAEETGLIVPIGWWMLHDACRQLRVWQQAFPESEQLWISVNLSARQLSQPDVIAQVQCALQESGLPAHCLKLEITETTLVEEGGRAGALLQELRSLGVQISMDDFGTGYSSLSYLQRLPVDVLKIDRTFIHQIGTEHGEIVQAILTLSHSLGLQTVAEGTETIEQVEQLRALQCEFGQGFFFSRALDPSAVEALLNHGAFLLQITEALKH